MKNIIKYVFSILFAGGLLYWTLKDYDFASNFLKLKETNPFWFVIVFIISLLSHISRAIRWRMLLKPLGYQPNIFRTTLAVLMGYFANYIVPRLGEVTRCGTLKNTDNIPFEKSFGTVITERVFDVICLLIILLLTFILEFNRLKDFFLSFFGEKFQTKSTFLIGIVIFLFLTVFFLIWIWKKYREKILAIALVQKIKQMISGFTEGFLSISKLEKPVWFVFHTVFIWVMYYLATYLLFFALPETSYLGMLAGLSVLAVGAIGNATPTPGGIGAFHALVSSLMVLYGLTTEQGKTLAIFLHGSQMITILILGIISFFCLLYINNTKNKVKIEN